MEEKKYKTVQVAGTLHVPGIDIIYHLLRPRPVEKDTWMDDDTNMFYIALEHGIKSYYIPRHIVIKGPFLIDYRAAGEEIKIETQEQEINLSENIDYSELFETANV